MNSNGYFKKNFTLIELLLVMGVIAILAAITIGITNLASRKAGEAQTKAGMKQLELAIEQYRDEYGYYPQTDSADYYPEKSDTDANGWMDISKPFLLDLQSQGIDVDISQLEFYQFNYKGNDEVYYGVDKCIDAFNNPYEYRCPGINNPKAFDLRSIGPDNQPNTEDDITNWQRN